MENKTPWEIFKERLILETEEPRVDEAEPELANKRFDICKECPLFNAELGICEDCGCFMENKTKQKGAECPLHKW